MSTIDSGLGWSCDSDYYVSDASTFIGTDRMGNTYTKTNTGAAIVGKMHWSKDDRMNILVISTVQGNAAITMIDSDVYKGSYTINGVTWYLYMMTYDNLNTDPNPALEWITGEPFSPYISDHCPENISALLTAANVQPTAMPIPTTNWVKTFVEGVEAETAVRVNALDTVKQPKTMSAAVSVGGVFQSTVENAISAMATKISKIDFDIHRNLGTEITAAQKMAIANGTFEDLPIGAYWTLNNTVYRIAHHDYYLGTGDTACTSHHIVVVPDNAMYSAAMNSTDTTTGGYAGSKMWTENLATALSTFETDFGAAHILNHRIIITNAVSNNQASGWAWTNSKVDLMSENMVCGHPAWGQAKYETGVERGQLVLFSLYPEFIQKQRSWYWLRSVGSGSDFCNVAGNGGASGYGASYSAGVRPYACIYFDDVLGG